MARHSKWANIKHKKSSQDAKRGKVFTRLAKLITVAAQQGGGGPEMNACLRAAIQKAKEENLPQENISRAIKKGTGELKDGVRLEERIYEGFGPGGAALLIRTITDNPNRSLGNIRLIFNKHGGALGASGSVSWMFSRKGILIAGPFPHEKSTVELLLIDAGAEEIYWDKQEVEVICPPEALSVCQKVLHNVPVQKSEITLLPGEEKVLTPDQERHHFSLLDALEEDEDVDEVFTNAALSDGVEISSPVVQNI